MSAMPGTLDEQRHPDAVLRHDDRAAPGPYYRLDHHLCVRTGGWRASRPARAANEGYTEDETPVIITEKVREQATTSGDFDPSELTHGKKSDEGPSFLFAWCCRRLSSSASLS